MKVAPKPLSAAVVTRLTKFLALLGSDQDGEVLAAAAAIKRTLKTEGLNYNDLAQALGAAAPQARQPPGWKPEWGPAYPMYADWGKWERDLREQERDHRADTATERRAWESRARDDFTLANDLDCQAVADCWRLRNTVLFSSKEADFISTMYKAFRHYQEEWKLTEAQRNWLHTLWYRSKDAEPTNYTYDANQWTGAGRQKQKP